MGNQESLDPGKRRDKDPTSSTTVAAFVEATVEWNNALYGVLLIAPPGVAAKIPQLDREVDRLLDLAVFRSWTRTEFRQERANLGRMAAEYLRLTRSLAGLPDIELPSIWTWDPAADHSGARAPPPEAPRLWREPTLQLPRSAPDEPMV
jgi:hypothetical protein